MAQTPEARQEALRREKAWRSWEADPERFFAGACRVRHPTRGSIPFELYEKQRPALELISSAVDAIILKARQIGMSTLIACYVLWVCFFQEDAYIVLLSRTEREAKKLLAKVKYAHKRMPAWVRNRAPKITSETLTTLVFENGSQIEAMPSTENPARGDTVTLIICDEWAHFQDPEGTWASIEPVTDIGGRIIGLSSANGLNYFHDLWQGAMAGTNGFESLFLGWDTVPTRDAEWYQGKASRMMPWHLNQEYPADAEEAFVKSGNPVFGIEVCDLHTPRDPEYVGAMIQNDIGSWVLGPEDPYGLLRIYTMPQPNHRYVLGVDTSEGLEHGDRSVVQVIDVTADEQAAVVAGYIDPDILARAWVHPLGFFYNVAMVGVESNNHGLTTLNVLANSTQYPFLYFRVTTDERTKRVTRKLGWYTDRRTKPLMIDELVTITRGDLKVPVTRIHDRDTLREMLSYRRNADGTMEGQPFDDHVMALAVAAMMRDRVIHDPDAYKPPVEPDDYGTVGWFAKMLMGVDDDAVRIGAHNDRKDW